MPQYYYFVKQFIKPHGQGIIKQYRCIRVPWTDSRVPAFTKEYTPIGWVVAVHYLFPPTKEEEQFQIQKRFSIYPSDDQFTIQTPEEAKLV